MIFCLKNIRSGKQTFAGVLEFIADNGTCILPRNVNKFNFQGLSYMLYSNRFQSISYHHSSLTYNLATSTSATSTTSTSATSTNTTNTNTANTLLGL